MFDKNDQFNLDLESSSLSLSNCSAEIEKPTFANKNKSQA